MNREEKFALVSDIFMDHALKVAETDPANVTEQDLALYYLSASIKLMISVFGKQEAVLQIQALATDLHSYIDNETAKH